MKNKKIHILWIISCVLISIVFLIPLYYTIANSLRSIYEFPVIIPRKFVFKNYYDAVTMIPFLRYGLSSVIICSIALSLGITIDFVYGYAFARLKARGKGILFGILLAQMMVPTFALQVPQYIAFLNLGIKDTYWIWVLTGISGSPFIVFLYKQYMENIPKELDEAALIDGCGYLRIIAQIYAPLCKSVIAIAVFTIFISEWGNYMTPFMFLTEKKYPLAIALFNQSYTMPTDPDATMDPVKYAAALMFAVPSLIVFFLCQRHLVSGVTAGSVKG